MFQPEFYNTATDLSDVNQCYVAYAEARAKAKSCAPKYGETSDFALATKVFALSISSGFKSHPSSALLRINWISLSKLTSPYYCFYVGGAE